MFPIRQTPSLLVSRSRRSLTLELFRWRFALAVDTSDDSMRLSSHDRTNQRCLVLSPSSDVVSSIHVTKHCTVAERSGKSNCPLIIVRAGTEDCVTWQIALVYSCCTLNGEIPYLLCTAGRTVLAAFIPRTCVLTLFPKLIAA